MKWSLFFVLFLGMYMGSNAQEIGNFTSLEPLTKSTDFVIPSTHVFQKLIEKGDPLTHGGTLPGNSDFTGYVPIDNSSENGYLSISSEKSIGGVTILDIHFNTKNKLWEISASQSVDFKGVAGTSKNCSGTVTPWNTIITCEEIISTSDKNRDGYYDFGWCVEIDPATKKVIDKRWSLGNFKHENVVIHHNRRTVYEGADSKPGYLYKFVANRENDLSSGALFVYKGSKNGTGKWIRIKNDSPADRNATLAQSKRVNATVFLGIEDVEIGPDGWVYFTVKGEGRVYRFQDSDPIYGALVLKMETYVGGRTYDVVHPKGVSKVDWGLGNDNLAFDGEGNLWVMQDGGKNYIWVVGKHHSQENPDVKIFGRTPIGSEPTGITFSPDYRFLFMSIQHPLSRNNSSMQIDAAGDEIGFGKDISLVIARKEDLGDVTVSTDEVKHVNILLYPNPSNASYNLKVDRKLSNTELRVLGIDGSLIFSKKYNNEPIDKMVIDLGDQNAGVYYFQIISNNKTIGIAKVFKK